ncbi:MAG: hypothetical protein M3O46_15140 [Myxococcota bacterium]|nr:hypothetical protein [Myxococcota bacterium]
MNPILGASLLACAVASTSCTLFTSHSCTGIVAICDQTTITLHSPNNAWSAGVYTLDLNIDGRATQCTLSIADPPPTGIVQGTCSATDITFTLAQLCPQPQPTCNDAGACGRLASSANCIAGQFQMTVSVLPHGFGTDAASGLASQVSIDLSVDGRALVNETIAPKATTTEPSGAGCGTCTNASATVSVAGA